MELGNGPGDDNIEFVENINGIHRVNNNKNHKSEMIMTNSTFVDNDNKFSNHSRGMSLNNNSNNNRQQQQHHQHQRKQNSEKNEFVSNLDKIKNMSVKDLLIILQREQESKTQLEDMLIGVIILIYFFSFFKSKKGRFFFQANYEFVDIFYVIYSAVREACSLYNTGSFFKGDVFF